MNVATSIQSGPFVEHFVAVFALGEALQQHRAATDASHGTVGDRDVVVHELELRYPELRKEDLRWIRDRDFTTAKLEDFRLRGSW